jgi:protein SCO1
VRDARWARTAVASLLIGVTGGALLFRGTNGFRALTTEQARRLAVERNPTAVPATPLEDQDGRALTLASFRGRPVIVDFVYTQCVSVCPLLSGSFQRLDRTERARDSQGGGRLQLVSISFDPRDTPARLKAYATGYGADGQGWRFVRVRDTTNLPALLEAFGIVVLPDGRGDYQHNAAIHVVNAQGRLAQVLDPDASPDAVARAGRAARSVLR